jgi:cytochrome d ubiquinol oxidase subunit I
MAMKRHHDSHSDGAPLIFFGSPNAAEKRIVHAIESPKPSIGILKHERGAPFDGLDTVRETRRVADGRAVVIAFWSIRTGSPSALHTGPARREPVAPDARPS